MRTLDAIDLAARRPAPRAVTRRKPSNRKPTSSNSAGGYTSTVDPVSGKVTRRRIRRAGNFVLRYYYR